VLYRVVYLPQVYASMILAMVGDYFLVIVDWRCPPTGDFDADCCREIGLSSSRWCKEFSIEDLHQNKLRDCICIGPTSSPICMVEFLPHFHMPPSLLQQNRDRETPH
jgi:hypothetical protein